LKRSPWDATDTIFDRGTQLVLPRTTYGIQRHVKNRMSIPLMDDGAEDVGNLNSSIRGEGRNLNVLRR